MSHRWVTVEIPLAETEPQFLHAAVQAAMKVFRERKPRHGASEWTGLGCLAKRKDRRYSAIPPCRFVIRMLPNHLRITTESSQAV